MPTSRNLELMNAFAIELKVQRNVLGISQEELAHRAGVDRTFVARLELAQNQPSLSVLFKISEGLGIKPEKMLALTSQRLTLGQNSKS